MPASLVFLPGFDVSIKPGAGQYGWNHVVIPGQHRAWVADIIDPLSQERFSLSLALWVSWFSVVGWLVGWLWGVWVVVGVGVGCPEFGVVWVRAGLWVGVGGGEVPAVVWGAGRVEGVHQVFVDEAVDSSVVWGVLRGQGVRARRRLVYVPVSGGGLGGLGVALVRGREFGVPVLVSGGGLSGGGLGRGVGVVAFPGGAQVVLPPEYGVGGEEVWGVLR
ncbi:hypothetical protein ACLQ24_28610, partial [Micromonospora sp. DT4]|uniref:hypothetical protein n=1 Tax=Micromonospora sp. DT4 TaxID=3393438 RepID=UPI003CE6B1D6